MKGLLIGLAAAKSKGDAAVPDKAKPAGDTEGSEEGLLRTAVQAIADGDEDGAVSALSAAIKACVAKGDEGEYEPPDAA